MQEVGTMEDYNIIDLHKFIDYYDSSKSGIYALFLKAPEGLYFWGIKNLEIMKLIQKKYFCATLYTI
ncbi:hypothetical protein SDC9_111859 [bioreactor metagenome]|uniref:Uncharacterized protein n=1 Tax=bioreactor metagenome TaxID=1076179 RepID=A0A645BHW6_9ZZZZ